MQRSEISLDTGMSNKGSNCHWSALKRIAKSLPAEKRVERLSRLWVGWCWRDTRKRTRRRRRFASHQRLAQWEVDRPSSCNSLGVSLRLQVAKQQPFFFFLVRQSHTFDFSAEDYGNYYLASNTSTANHKGIFEIGNKLKWTYANEKCALKSRSSSPRTLSLPSIHCQDDESGASPNWRNERK